MEDIVNMRELRWQLQLISQQSTTGQNAERTNVAWSKLALDSELMSASQRSDTQISLFTRLIS